MPKNDEKKVDKGEWIDIYGARMHNLKNIDVRIPRNSLVTITGISGSGKSSLAFDTIYAEGQRRYLETFSAYARQFIGELERPDVDKIDGLSPVIAIEQKTVGRNPRSTVGTITEVYDFLRLLYARVADAYSYTSGQKMERLSVEKIIDIIDREYQHINISILAPLIKSRKGHYRELFEQIRKQGYTKVRVDGKMMELTPKMQLDRYKIHDIEIVIDRLIPSEKSRTRLIESVKTGMKAGKGIILVLNESDEHIKYFSKFLMDPVSGLSYDEPQPNSFSFNSPYGACPECDGIGFKNTVDLKSIIPDESLSIIGGGLAPLGEYRDNWTFKQIQELSKKYKFSLSQRMSDMKAEHLNIILYGTDEPLKVSYTFTGGNSMSHTVNWTGLIPLIMRQFYDKGNDSISAWAAEYVTENICQTCQGGRLKKESLHYLLDGKNIAEISSMELDALELWFNGIEKKLTEKQQVIAFEILREIKTRLGFLTGIGLGYLTLNSPARTLSGGETQRIRLASQIGSTLEGVLYILDEPSIGLHQRDNQKLIESLKRLRDVGNSVIVVEHDKEMIVESDYIIDIGPGAGIHGGEIIAAGDIKEIKQSQSETALYISGEKKIEVPEQRRKGNGNSIVLKGCQGHNLKNISVSFPLGQLICVTGVSGSGKSSLITETLLPTLKKFLYKSNHKSLPYKEITGFENVDKIIEIDQDPIGRTPRSNPATYVEVFTDIRNLFSQIPEAKIRGFKPGRFSFNVKGGRCEGCQGGGMKLVEMNFLPDVYIHCDVCNGKRYNPDTLSVKYKGKTISDVLDMNIETACDFFSNIPNIYRKIETLKDVGLGYITLGQPSTTLSGGEAQRIKLATELSKRDTGNTFYILDEPTTGLHFEDVNVLMKVLNKLTDKGNTVLVIEHNLDVIKLADYIIDLGPEGGKYGGEIVAMGTPEEIIKYKKSHTGKYLKDELKNKTLKN